MMVSQNKYPHQIPIEKCQYYFTSKDIELVSCPCLFPTTASRAPLQTFRGWEKNIWKKGYAWGHWAICSPFERFTDELPESDTSKLSSAINKLSDGNVNTRLIFLNPLWLNVTCIAYRDWSLVSGGGGRPWCIHGWHLSLLAACWIGTWTSTIKVFWFIPRSPLFVEWWSHPRALHSWSQLGVSRISLHWCPSKHFFVSVDE